MMDDLSRMAGAPSLADYTAGQRVMTPEGFPGVIDEVLEGPRSLTTYMVTLDNGMGGGEYSESEIQLLQQSNASRIDASIEHTAADDYPELGSILSDRLPPQITTHSAKKVAADLPEEFCPNSGYETVNPRYDGEMAECFACHHQIPIKSNPGRDGLVPLHRWRDGSVEDWGTLSSYSSKTANRLEEVAQAAQRLADGLPRCTGCGEAYAEIEGEMHDHWTAAYEGTSVSGTCTTCGKALVLKRGVLTHKDGSNDHPAQPSNDSNAPIGVASSLTEAETIAQHLALYLPPLPKAEQRASTSDITPEQKAGYDEGFSHGREGITRNPSDPMDEDFVAGYAIGWAEGVLVAREPANSWDMDDLNADQRADIPSAAPALINPPLSSLAASPDIIATEAGLWDLIKGDPQPNKGWGGVGAEYSYDWCRFRKMSHCHLPKELNEPASKQAGYAVWVPFDRGTCPRVKWEQQQVCPTGEPGPHVPGGYTDATVPWEQGGQHGGVPTAASLQTHAVFEVTATWRDVREKAKRIRSEEGVRLVAMHDNVVVAHVRGDHGIYETELVRHPGRANAAAWHCGCKWSSYSWGRSGPWKRYEGRMCSHALAVQYEAQSRGAMGRTLTLTLDEKQPAWMDGKHVHRPGDYDKDKQRYSSISTTAAQARCPICGDTMMSQILGMSCMMCGTLIPYCSTEGLEVLFDDGLLAKERARYANLHPVEAFSDDEPAPSTALAHAMLAGGSKYAEVRAMLLAQGVDRPVDIIKQARSATFWGKVRGVVERLLLKDDGVEDGNGRMLSPREVLYPGWHPTKGLNLNDRKMGSKDENVPPSEHGDPRLQDAGVSVKRTPSGKYYIHTHRARGEDRDSVADIPDSEIEAIEATGSLHTADSSPLPDWVRSHATPPTGERIKDLRLPPGGEFTEGRLAYLPGYGPLQLPTVVALVKTVSRYHMVGYLMWRDHVIDSVHVDDEFQRMGIATEMLSFAREIDPALQHSTTLLPDGRAWSQAVASLTKQADEDQCPVCSGDSLAGGRGYVCQDCGHDWSPNDPHARAFHGDGPLSGIPFGEFWEIPGLMTRRFVEPSGGFNGSEVSYDYQTYPPFLPAHPTFFTEDALRGMWLDSPEAQAGLTAEQALAQVYHEQEPDLFPSVTAAVVDDAIALLDEGFANGEVPESSVSWYAPTPAGQQVAYEDGLLPFEGKKKDDGPSVSGVALKALDTGRILMLQRGLEDQKDPARGAWEFPGGHHEDGDTTSLHAGIREWEEEVGIKFPEGGLVAGTWQSPDGVYQGHVVTIPEEKSVILTEGRDVDNPDDPDGDASEQVAWWDPDHAKKNPALREECKATPWDMLKKATSSPKEGSKMDIADEFGSLFDEAAAAGPPRTAVQQARALTEWGLDPVFADLHDEPEPALPTTDGADDEDTPDKVAARLAAAFGSLPAQQTTPRHEQAFYAAHPLPEHRSIANLSVEAGLPVCPKCQHTIAAGDTLELVGGVGLQHKGRCPSQQSRQSAVQDPAARRPGESEEERGRRLLAYVDASMKGQQVEGPNPFAHLVAGQADNEIAAGAANFLVTKGGIQTEALKTYSPVERQQIIAEGENSEQAGNLDRLDITGTHYEALEATAHETLEAVSSRDVSRQINGGRDVPEDEDMTFLDGDPNLPDV